MRTRTTQQWSVLSTSSHAPSSPHLLILGVGRGLTDQSRSLWCSWVVRTPTHDMSVYFAGDTGYTSCTAFKEIGERYGPFDLAMIPIWRGASLSILGRWGLRVRPISSLAFERALCLPRSSIADRSSDVPPRYSTRNAIGRRPTIPRRESQTRHRHAFRHVLWE